LISVGGLVAVCAPRACGPEFMVVAWLMQAATME
jgi:hypothetical protein